MVFPATSSSSPPPHPQNSLRSQKTTLPSLPAGFRNIQSLGDDFDADDDDNDNHDGYGDDDADDDNDDDGNGAGVE